MICHIKPYYAILCHIIPIRQPFWCRRTEGYQRLTHIPPYLSISMSFSGFITLLQSIAILKPHFRCDICDSFLPIFSRIIATNSPFVQAFLRPCQMCSRTRRPGSLREPGSYGYPYCHQKMCSHGDIFQTFPGIFQHLILWEEEVLEKK